MDDSEAGPLLTSEDDGTETADIRKKQSALHRGSSARYLARPSGSRSSKLPGWMTLNRNFRCVIIFFLAITGYVIIHNVVISTHRESPQPSSSLGGERIVEVDVRNERTEKSFRKKSEIQNKSPSDSTVQKNQAEPVKDLNIKPYDFSIPDYAPPWYQETCFGDTKLGIDINDIYAKLAILENSGLPECKHIRTIFDRVFRMDKIEAPIVLPEEFKPEVKGWLGNDSALFDQVTHQKIYKIVNKYSFEETVFNPLRSKRPTSKSAVDPLVYIANITDSTKPTCDFCSFEKHTAADSFGRVINKYSATASNTFKLAKFHGLFFPKTHHPINISREAIIELFNETSRQWFEKAYNADPSQRYPSLLWDVLPHAGASQIHPHIHGILDSHQYAGSFEKFHDISQLYFRDYGSSFWSDIVLAHWALGLGTAVGDGKSVIIVPLFARKDHEFLIVSSKADAEFATSINVVLNAYKENLKVFCFSAGGAYPFMGSYMKKFDRYSFPGLPALFRFGSRGSCASTASDVSSLELYTVNNINSNISVTYQAVLDASSPQ